jgi:hypothetical protein
VHREIDFVAILFKLCLRTARTLRCDFEAASALEDTQESVTLLQFWCSVRHAGPDSENEVLFCARHAPL